MSKLEDLEQKLYGKEGDENIAKRIKEKITLVPSLRTIAPFWASKESKQDSAAPSGKRGITPFTIFVITTTLLVIVGGVFFAFLYFGLQRPEVTITIPDIGSVEAGEVVTIPITIKNISSVPLRDVELTLVLPSDVLVIQEGRESPAPARLAQKIGDLGVQEEQTVQILARMFGTAGEPKDIQATVLYRPENLQATFSARALQKVTIGTVPFNFSWDVPDILADGQNVDVQFHYVSHARNVFRGAAIQIDYPSGFQYISSTPSPSFGNNVWRLSDVNPGEEGVIAVHGTISGQEGEVKAFQGGLGSFNPSTKEWKSYSEISHELKIAVQPLSITAKVGDSRDTILTLGAPLNYILHYKNNTTVALRNVSVRSVLEESTIGGVLVPETLQIQDGGVFDSSTNAIVWGPVGVTNFRTLAPGAEGDLHMSVQTRGTPIVKNTGDKNFVVRLRSTIDAGDVPDALAGTRVASQDLLETKVQSKILFSGKPLFNTSSFANTGPLPPKVGRATTYAITWEIKNFTNDLKNAEVKASLPPNIKWMNVVYPKDARIQYDANSGVVTWSVGDISAGTGVISPTRVASFQVALTPSISDVGRYVPLAQEAHLTGLDTFTNENRDEVSPALTTELREDSKASNAQLWSVVK